MCYSFCFFFQAEDGIRDLVRSRGLGDVYKRQGDALLRNVAAHLQGVLGDAIVARLGGDEFAILFLSLIHI